VTVDIPERLVRATVRPKANNGGYLHTFEPGSQHLNGELALAYARFRGNTDGDFGRINRQQQIAQAAMSQALSLGWAAHADEIWAQYRSAVQTDLQAAQVAGYALVASRLPAESIRTASLGAPDAATEAILSESGADVLIPVPQRIAAIIDDSLGDLSYGDSALASLRRQYPVAPVPIGRRNGGPPVIRTPVSPAR
jgi:anionic cell wall polymer biosynthesis LytR-Cps2A-Psr (LCP) family protein